MGTPWCSTRRDSSLDDHVGLRIDPVMVVRRVGLVVRVRRLLRRPMWVGVAVSGETTGVWPKVTA
ncbi:MAG: hypothetical protein SangKO_061210 [Sandaracinaceae bacterium]